MHMVAVKRTAFSVREAAWSAESAALRGIRTEVFILEQHVPEADEWDGLDAGCFHALAVDGSGDAIGTGRLSIDGKIGRMAVLKEWRGSGVGTGILGFLVTAARGRRLEECVLHAQCQALTFYERQGFEPIGAEFLEAGIPHRRMRLRL